MTDTMRRVRQLKNRARRHYEDRSGSRWGLKQDRVWNALAWYDLSHWKRRKKWNRD
jgi:hypothetical protein